MLIVSKLGHFAYGLKDYSRRVVFGSLMAQMAQKAVLRRLLERKMREYLGVWNKNLNFARRKRNITT